MNSPQITVACVAPFREAAQTLGVEADVDAKALKRAYRVQVSAHPPDTDPEGFRRIRSAYELLSDPAPRLDAILSKPIPYIEPPRLRAQEALTDRALAAALVQAWAGMVDLESLLLEAESE